MNTNTNELKERIGITFKVQENHLKLLKLCCYFNPLGAAICNQIAIAQQQKLHFTNNSIITVRWCNKFGQNNI